MTSVDAFTVNIQTSSIPYHSLHERGGVTNASNSNSSIVTTTAANDDPSDDYDRFWFLSNTGYWIFTAIIISLAPLVISIIGIISNIINILVFYRQGILVDSCTSSLFVLSMSDFILCLLKFVASVSLAPLYIVRYMIGEQADYMMENASALGIIISTHILLLTSITGWITAYIALERMTSVMFPFHVKRMFTPKRSYITIAAIFVCVFILYIPRTICFKVNFMDGNEDNATARYNAVFLEFTNLVSMELANLSSEVNEIYLRSICFSLVVIFNGILIIKVNLAKRFRQSTSATTKSNPNPVEGDTKAAGHKVKVKSKDSNQQSSSVNKNKELVLTKMIIVLCIMFIVCYLPSLLFNMSMFVIKVKPVFMLSFDLVSIFTETINSSFNLIVYKTMSTKFNKELSNLYKCSKKS